MKNYKKKINSISSVREQSYAKPYSEIPGPKELPVLGNAWRFAPIIGKE
jgi:hypothetical protein